MRKFTKGMLLGALITGIAGTAFCIAGLCAGFSMEAFHAAAEDGMLRASGPEGWIHTAAEKLSSVSIGRKDFEQKFNGVESLNLDAGVADCTLIPYDGSVWKVYGYQVPGSFRCEQDNDDLKIDCRSKLFSFMQWSDRETRLEIYVPKDQIIEELHMEVGVGTLTTSGSVLKCEELEIDCGVGDADLYADVTRSVQIDGGVGSLTLTLLGDEEDFNFDLDNGVGTIQVGEETYGELGEEVKLDYHAEKDIEIDSGVGDITVEFTGTGVEASDAIARK